MKIKNGTLVFVEYNVMSVTIPDNVTNIDDYAFSNCANLTSITIPNNVTRIGIAAFSHCTNLTSITIPDSVTSIGKCAFFGCTNLRYNTYDNAQYLGNAQNPYLVLVKATANDIISCAIHARAKIIYGSAFEGCTALTNIAIPNSVRSIGGAAFSGCTELTSITIPDSVTSIGTNAFSGCTGLTSVTIGNGATNINSGAFSGCTGLTNITIPDSVMSIGYEAFYGCAALATIQNNYKAFALNRKQLFCRRKYFYIGKRGWVKGPLKLCENGIHFCTNLFDVFNYYAGNYGKEFVIALCDVSDEQDATGAEDSKRCARWVRPTHILTRKELIALLNNPIKGGEN